MPSRKQHNVVAMPPSVAPVIRRNYIIPRDANVCESASMARVGVMLPGAMCGCISCAPRHWCADCIKTHVFTWVRSSELPPASEQTLCTRCRGVRDGSICVTPLREVYGHLSAEEFVKFFGKPPVPRFEPLPEVDVMHNLIELQRQYIEHCRLYSQPETWQTMPVPQELAETMRKYDETMGATLGGKRSKPMNRRARAQFGGQSKGRKKR